MPVAIIYDGSRVATRAQVTKSLALTHPGLAPEAATNCVMSGFTRAEIVKMGTSDTTVLTTKHSIKIAEVVARAKPAACLAPLTASA